MGKTLMQKVREEFAKLDISIIEEKEYLEKYKALIQDNETGYKINWEINKRLQWNKIRDFALVTKEHLRRCYEFYKSSNKEKE